MHRNLALMTHKEIVKDFLETILPKTKHPILTKVTEVSYVVRQIQYVLSKTSFSKTYTSDLIEDTLKELDYIFAEKINKKGLQKNTLHLNVDPGRVKMLYFFMKLMPKTAATEKKEKSKDLNRALITWMGGEPFMGH